MRGIRALILLALGISLVLSPLAAAAQPGQAPQAAKDKAKLEQDAARAGAPQEAKPEAKPAAAQAAPAQDAKPAAKKPAKKGEVKRTELLVPAYTGIKEKSNVFVFFAWLWLSIIVLIYFLRLWVREADRVYKAKYYEPEESPRKNNPLPRVLGD